MRPLFFFALVSLLASPALANDDARVGTVIDRQGTALVRPVGRDRWTPIGPKSILMPGDLVRTPVRGANAVEIRLAGKGRLLVGPGSLVEIPASDSVRLLRGEIEATDIKTVGLPSFLGPNGPIAKAKTRIYRTDGKKTQILPTAPRWLSGYRKSTTDEWMGSLVAQVDGRDVPLSVGYHKVTVDIRDQIARTTVEQSFVNATDGTLEGVFYFPLPADASISGFGMWIGGELVEADIVEKQRARAIYEDILRQRKDPGLLEWSGGNLFKARVFPIFPHSEKRIRVQYTQVLPLEGSTVRYRYALRSELLRARPLRQLQLKVRVSSSMPIVAIDCPSHAVRVRKTKHAASAEFDAEEYAPERDFELRIGLDRSQPLTVVPHRRGDDGYFMLLLAPPDAGAAAWQRELMPETEPLEITLVADTSGSMDRSARAAQAAFLDALLSLLGPKDKFRLMTCDVTVRSFRADALPVTEKNTAAALAWLERRASLGWTDLDLAFRTARGVANDRSVLIYVGDGIGTTGDADPVALAERLRRLGKGVCHAVFPSSTYEKGVLDAIASIGGGSVRSGAGDPVEAAYALLAEAAQPAVKDLKVSFEGLRTARVYPRRLPNLAAGTQQVVLGRFLPTGGDQSGTVIVEGTIDGKPVRYSTKLTIQADEAGNSFLPRLWARRHLDALLAQGNAPAIQDEIVAFSEEYGIMTPYTSFLVLESDAQREQYGVTRRVRMRDGERFFATGRDRASTELLQQQMKLARSWRLRLRAAMLREIATLGRYLHGRNNQSSAAVSASPLFFASKQSETARSARNSLRENIVDEGVDLDADVDGEEYEEERELDKAPAEEARSERRKSGKKIARDRMDFRPPSIRGLSGGEDWRGRRSQEYRAREAIVRLSRFPSLPAPPVEPQKTPEPNWPAPVLEQLRSLDRRAALEALAGGIRVRQTGSWLHAANGHVTSTLAIDALYGHSGWYLRNSRTRSPVYDAWLARGRVGALDVGLRLGRQRDATPADRRAWPLPIPHQDLARTYRAFSAERKDGLIILRAPAPARQEFHLRFDAGKRVLTEWISFHDGKKTRTTRWHDFVQAGGLWWAQRVEHFDAEDRMVQRTRRTVESLAADAFDQALAAATAGHEDCILLAATDPTLDEAKQAVHDKRARFVDHSALAQHFLASQQWELVFEQWGRAEALVPGKPGARWLRAELLVQGRRGAEAQDLLQSLAPPSGPAKSYLAHLALSLAQSVFQANEMVAMVERLKPALPEADYLRSRAMWLGNAGQPDQALAVQAVLATKRPFDINDLLAYFRGLQAAQRSDDAVQLIVGAIRDGKWLTQELDRLYGAWTDQLWARRELDELLGVTMLWKKESPKCEDAYQRYLSMLLFLEREKEADAWAAAKLAGEPGAAMGAAIQYALGQGWQYHANRVEESWWKPLGELGLRLVRGDPNDWLYAWRIIAHHQFMGTDEGKALRTAMRAELVAQDAIETMPLDRMARLLTNLQWTQAHVDDPTWRAVTDRLKARWNAEAEEGAKRSLSGFVLHLLDARREKLEAIEFLRVHPVDPALARQLMTRLAAVPWTAEREAERFIWLKRLQPESMRDADRVRMAGFEVRQLVEQLEAARYAALTGPAKELEKLPRSERRLKERTSRVAARKELAAALAVEKGRADEWSAPWIELERLGLMAQTATGDVNGNTRELFGSAEDEILKERCAYLLAYIATRRKAPDALPDEVLAFLEAQKDEAIDWRAHIFRLLAALGRNEPLETTLNEWIDPARAESRWRIALGYLYAESGRLEEAVSQFDAVARANELGFADYEAFASWLLVLDRKKEREQALYRRYLVVPEYQLQRRIYQQYYKRARKRENAAPEEFDPDTLRALRALFTKASRPANYVHLTRSLYQANKDFRVLACLAYGAIGHTPQGVYPFLQQSNGVLRQVHEEATCDALVAHIRELRKDAKSDLDRRALLLLLASVERRAAEVLNAPGPHAEQGLRAMTDAFSGSWLDGERRLYASWLASLGKIPIAAFAELQENQLRELAAAEPAGTLDRLMTHQFLAQTLWQYGRADAAIDTLTAALDEYETACGGLRHEAHAPLRTLIKWLERRNRHGVAEARLESEWKRAATASQRDWLEQLLFSVYVDALQRGASVSYGRGRALYTAARERIQEAMWNNRAAGLRDLLGIFCSLHRAGQKAGSVPEAGADLERFARQKLPELLTRAMSDRGSLVHGVADTLRQLRGARVALELLIVSMENEPAWLERTGRDGWRWHGWRIARWRAEAGDIGALTQRLLSLATRALETDLLLLRSQRSGLMQISSGYFWASQADAFRSVALKVIELHPASEARLVHAARYLWSGLHQFEDAISTLQAAEARGVLHQGSRWQLVVWLQERKRWDDSLPLLEILLGVQPDRLQYLRARVRALHYLQRDEQARQRFDAASERFKQIKRWDEGVISLLAALARECGFNERAAKLYEELIPLHQRTQRNRGVGGGTLAGYYGALSSVYLALGRVDEAVDAASAAVVSWGRTHRNRKEAIAALLSVIVNLNDLDGYVERYESKAAETGLDAPLIRKCLGKAYRKRKDPAKAAAQLLVARELQPNDAEVHQELLGAYDALGDADRAIAALLDGIAMAPLNLDLYADLGARLEKAGEKLEAERAWTTLVEVLPNEAASHRRLAEYRASVGDHAAAVEQWRQVVRVRRDEPDGWLQLARAQIAAADKQGAAETLRHILATDWPNASIHKQAKALLK